MAYFTAKACCVQSKLWRGDQVPPQGHAWSGPSCFEKQKAEDGSSAISSAVISASVRPTSPPSSKGSGTGCDRTRRTQGCCQDSWCHQAWCYRTGQHSRLVQLKTCLFIEGWDAALSCSASHSGQGPFLSTAASPLWLFSSIWGQGLYFTPSVGPVDSSEGEFYCSVAGRDAKGRCQREVRVSGEHDRERE